MARLRVGIVGAAVDRGWAHLAHIPALKGLSDQFEIKAVSTTRQESADKVAKAHGIPLAFGNANDLIHHPEIDIVAVTVKVPDHQTPVMAALAAKKHVYCEWPLGRTTQEAETMLEAARAAGVKHAVGLQGQVSPAVNYVRDLIAQGWIGRPLAATMIQSAGNWGATLDRAYQADHANGANMLTITCGHAIDALCYTLGEFAELSAFSVRQRDSIPLEGTLEPIPLTVPDQIALSGITSSGTVVAFQVRGGMRRGTAFQFEIHGEAGDLRMTTNGSVQRGDAVIQGAQGKGAYAELPVPAHYSWLPPERQWGDSGYNVAQLYVKLGQAIRDGGTVSPGFAEAVTRHKLLDRIEQASETGRKSKL